MTSRRNPGSLTLGPHHVVLLRGSQELGSRGKVHHHCRQGSPNVKEKPNGGSLTEESENPDGDGRTSLEDLSLNQNEFRFECPNRTHEDPGPPQLPRGAAHEGNPIRQETRERARHGSCAEKQPDAVLKLVAWVPKGQTGEVGRQIKLSCVCAARTSKRRPGTDRPR